MRKWMSDRMKRRKKVGDGSAKEATKAPEPLQPRFYDDEPVAPAEAPVVEAPVAKSRPPSRPKPEPATEPVAEAEAASTEASTATATEGEPRARVSRRRRSRGGRGGSRTKPAAAVAETSTAEASEPGTSATAAVAAEASVPEPAVAGQSPVETVPAHVVPAQAAMPVQAAPAPARASKGTVVLAIGLPGSGKSSWFKRHDIHPLSSDLLRELLFDDAQEQRFQDLVFSNLRSMLKARLIARRPMNYVDATNLTPHDRHSWIKLAKDYGYDVQGLFFDVPVEICMERHQRRGRAVPEDIMRKMAGKLKPPTFEEGFSKITVVRVKQKEAAAG
ncbi:MAG: AAA family ATPase [Terriglobales bacterium]|jgi:predicted kinase